MAILLNEKALAEERELKRQVKKALIESPESDHPAAVARREKQEADREGIRGVPVVGRPGGIGGAIAGTKPEAATLRKLGREEARRKRAGLDE